MIRILVFISSLCYKLRLKRRNILVLLYSLIKADLLLIYFLPFKESQLRHMLINLRRKSAFQHWILCILLSKSIDPVVSLAKLCFDLLVKPCRRNRSVRSLIYLNVLFLSSLLHLFKMSLKSQLSLLNLFLNSLRIIDRFQLHIFSNFLGTFRNFRFRSYIFHLLLKFFLLQFLSSLLSFLI